MKLPKGFGKNYFTLRAITATTNQVTLHAQCSRVQNFHMINFLDKEAETQEEEPAATAGILKLSSKPCRCNCFYKRRAKKTLILHAHAKSKSKIFITLNTSISPPLDSISLNLAKQKIS